MLTTTTRWAVVVLLAALLPLTSAGRDRAAVAAVPEPRFEGERTYAARFVGNTFAMADLTGDGRLDIVSKTGWTQDAENGYKLFLYAQTAEGTLEQRARLDTSDTGPQYAYGGLAVADFNGDGRTDVAVPAGVGVDVFLQHDGTLRPGVVVPLPGARQVKAADIDRDGRADLVVTGSGGVSVVRSTGAGAFAAPMSVSTLEQREIDIGDITGDGRPDIVGFRQSHPDRSQDGLHVFPQSASGGFAEDRRYAGGFGLALGDFTGDGRADVAQTIKENGANAGLMLMPQRSDGTLGPAVFYDSYDLPSPLEAADVNGDGRLDLVTLHDGWWAAGVYLQQEDGTMAAERLYTTAYGNFEVNSLAVGDFTRRQSA